MDINLRGLAKTSSVSGRAFHPGDRVESFLFRLDAGEIERADLHSDEVEGWHLPGAILCRWGHRVREREDEEAEARRSALLSAEELFFALFEAEQSAASDESAKVTRDRRVLLTLLALLLERKRLIKARGRGLYWHPGSKREIRIQPMALTPEEILAVQEQLSDLV